MKVRGQEVLDPLDRIMRSSIPEPNCGCWLWTGTIKNSVSPYGSITIGSRSDGTRRTERAHRYAYRVIKGEIPQGMEVCHHCDVPSCVNPDHLWLGTKQENAADRDRKGRNKPQFGEVNGQSRLSLSDVAEIRASPMGCRRLSRAYGVDKKTIQRVRNGTHWIPAAPTPTPTTTATED